jgi:hypothetical protein
MWLPILLHFISPCVIEGTTSCKKNVLVCTVLRLTHLTSREHMSWQAGDGEAARCVPCPVWDIVVAEVPLRLSPLSRTKVRAGRWHYLSPSRFLHTAWAPGLSSLFKAPGCHLGYDSSAWQNCAVGAPGTVSQPSSVKTGHLLSPSSHDIQRPGHHTGPPCNSVHRKSRDMEE